jgi:hypothetical protein
MPGHRDDGGAAAVHDSTAPDLDLVEYVVISVPDLSAAVGVAAALKQLVESAQIRILDLVGVDIGPDGRFAAVEPEQLAGLAALDSVEGEVGGLLRRPAARHVGPDGRRRGPLGPAAGGRRTRQRREDHRR